MSDDKSKRTYREFQTKGRRGTVKILLSQKPDNQRVQDQQIKQKPNPTSGTNFVERRPDDFIVPRKPSGINFYDLGQIKNDNGVFVSNLAALVPAITMVTDTIIQTNETEADKIALLSQMEAIIFDIVEAQWLNRFFKIQKSDTDFEKSVSVLIGVDSDDPFFGTLNEAEDWWKTEGLVLKPQEAATLVVQPNGVLYAIGNIDFADLEGSYINKITSVRDSSADSVEFTPSAKMDIFLMPSIQNSQGQAVYYDGLHTSGPQSDFIKRADHLNYIRSVFNRALWNQFLVMNEANQNGELTNYQLTYKLWLIIKQFANARARRQTTDFAETPPYPYSTVLTTIPASSFPYTAIYTNTTEPTSPDPFTNDLSHIVYMANDLFSLQQLKFIIRQAGQTFYFWYLED